MYEIREMVKDENEILGITGKLNIRRDIKFTKITF